MDVSRKGLLIDYEYCSGCHACEVACQMEKGLPPDQFGIKLSEIGPWTYGGSDYSGSGGAEERKIQYSFIPVPTDQCDLCATRIVAGKQPTCVKHCMSRVISYGSVSQLKEALEDKPKLVLFTVQ